MVKNDDARVLEKRATSARISIVFFIIPNAQRNRIKCVLIEKPVNLFSRTNTHAYTPTDV